MHNMVPYYCILSCIVSVHKRSSGAGLLCLRNKEFLTYCSAFLMLYCSAFMMLYCSALLMYYCGTFFAREPSRSVGWRFECWL